MSRRFLFGIFGLVSAFFLSFTSSAAERQIDVALQPFPNTTRTLQLGEQLKLVDFSVSPSKPVVTLLLKDNTGQQILKFWNLEEDKLSDGIAFDKRVRLTWIVWHPVDQTLFFLAKQGATTNLILRAEQAKHWKPIELFTSSLPLQRLVIGPRPFAVDYVDSKPILEYRLFYGVKKDNAYAIDSITESGRIRYQVIGRGPQYVSESLAEFPPSFLPPAKGSVLPVAFHPAGNQLVWEDPASCFNSTSYDRDSWGNTSRALYRNEVCKGEIWMLPNGTGVLHWIPKQKGFTLHMDGGSLKLKRAESTLFNSLPIVTPDGKGVVGWIRSNNQEVLRYEPISIPLADVANAWMFIEKQADRSLLEKHGGMFRSLKKYTQLYQLYESELYSCGGYAETTPTRPYIVTTDIFWETAAAAFQGLFVVSEREQAVPAFWTFVAKAHGELLGKPDSGHWQKVFTTLLAIKKGAAIDPPVKAELAKILAASGRASDILGGAAFDFTNLKPRGHYTNSTEASQYFRAFRYFVQASESLGTGALSTLSPDTKRFAVQWVKSYLPFIAAPRAELVWGTGLVKPAGYAREPKPPSVFPLSWGFDNEALFNTVYHQNWPKKDAIVGRNGPRLLPMALDLAAIFGSRFAESILEDAGEFANFPNLRPRIGELRQQYRSIQTEPENLYNRWLSALAVQWSDSVITPGNEAGKELYLAKRLQTGLASWATLRHATGLVNERSNAECGEGGFERIQLQFPRGYVETDPASFEAIAQFFDDMSRMVTTRHVGNPGVKSTPLEKGIQGRLAESAATVRHFKAIAEKELKNIPLTLKEYEDIFYVGRAAEHNFLVFKSLIRPGLALANPDPIPKVSDVAGQNPLLNVAVGEPMEWDFIYPALGRRMVGKGSVYSFYEFSTATPINDAEWQAKLGKQRRPAWVEPYMSQEELTCPAKSPL